MRLQAQERPAFRILLGARIRKHRLSKKMTQEQAAELSNLDPKYFGEVERGETTISIDRLYILSQALGTSVRELTRDF